MAVTVVGDDGGACGGGFGEHGGGCPLPCRACAVPPAPALQAASATATTASSAGLDLRRARRARPGDRLPATAPAPLSDDQLIAIPPVIRVMIALASRGLHSRMTGNKRPLLAPSSPSPYGKG